METTAGGWTVIDRAGAVLTSTYKFAKGATSTAFVARMGNGQLMVVSPSVGVTDAAIAELAEFGEVGAIVANNGFHHLGQAEWRRRFPAARCFAPVEAMPRIKKKNPDAGAFEPLPALAELTGADVGFRQVERTKCGESWFWARTATGHAWYASDVLANMQTVPAPFPLKLLFKWTKSAPGYRVFNLALKFIVKDRPATLRALRDDLTAHPPTVMVPGHGAILEQAGLADETQALIAPGT